MEVVVEVVVEVVLVVPVFAVGRFLLFDFLLSLVVPVFVAIDGAAAVDADDGEGGSSSDPVLDGVRTGRAG